MHAGEKEFRELLDGWKDDPEFVAESIALELSVSVNSVLKSKKMTQKLLAEKIKVSPGRISQIMSGNFNLTLLTMCKVAIGVGLRPSLTFSPSGINATPSMAYGELSNLGTVSAAPVITLGQSIYSTSLSLPIPYRVAAGGIGAASTGGSEKGAAA